MLRLHLLGHTYAELAGHPVHLSTKAVALLTYLTLENRPHHRDHLADLLWDHSESRQNLRVELNRIRSQGIAGFPLGQRMLGFQATETDLQRFESLSPTITDLEQLQSWLSLLRGLPLTSLDDVGSVSFRSWIDQQRVAIEHRVLNAISATYHLFARHGHTTGTTLINTRLVSLGYTPLPPPVLQSGEVVFERAERPQLHAVHAAAQQRPQLFILDGPPGSGKSFEVKRLARETQSELIHGDIDSPRLTLAAIAQRLLGHADQENRAILKRILLEPHTDEQDMVALAYVLSQINVPLLLWFKDGHLGSKTMAGYLQLLLQGRGALLLILTMPEGAARGRLANTLTSQLSPEQWRELHLAPLRVNDVLPAVQRLHAELAPDAVEAIAASCNARGRGNAIHVRALLQDLTTSSFLPEGLRQRLAQDVEKWPSDARERLERLSLTYGLIDERTVATLGLTPQGEELTFIQQAHDLRALHEDVRVSHLTLNEHGFKMHAGHSTSASTFSSEALRIYLATRLPAPVRRHTNMQLAHHFVTQEPGLAAVYADRAGDHALSERCRAQYAALAPYMCAEPAEAQPARTTPPPTTDGNAIAPVSAHGYALSLENGRLFISRSGPFGHAPTLRLRLPLPASASEVGSLRVTWQLQTFNGAFELMPRAVPFPLGIRTPSSPVMVFTPHAQKAWEEVGVSYRTQHDVGFNIWMEHHLVLPARQGESHVELNFRGVDLAITIARITWNDRLVFPLPTLKTPQAIDHMLLSKRRPYPSSLTARSDVH